MKQFTDWFQRSQNVVDTSAAPPSLRDVPPYILTSAITSDDLLGAVGGEFAFNHSLLIGGVVGYTTYSGDNSYLEIAKTTADWEIENSTPADWAMPYLAPSLVNYQPDGSWTVPESGYEPDKSAYLAVALLRLYSITGEHKYREAAVRIGNTLRRFQRPEGNTPFRMDARTGDVELEYTESQLWYVWMYEHLAEVTGDDSYMLHRNRAFEWLLDNPVRTNDWYNLYGDQASGIISYDQWVPLEVAMYLIEHRAENSHYVDVAKAIVDWVEQELVADSPMFPGVPGVWEQGTFHVVLTHHQLRLAEAYAKLWEATGNLQYKRRGIEVANSVTWCLMADGKMRYGFFGWTAGAGGVPLVLSYNDQFMRIMSSIPETAPKGETHLIQASSLIKDIRYRPTVVTYETTSASYDVLIVASAPIAVTSGGRGVHPVDDPQRDVGWHYDPGVGLLRIRHEGGPVEVRLHQAAG